MGMLQAWSLFSVVSTDEPVECMSSQLSCLPRVVWPLDLFDLMVSCSFGSLPKALLSLA